MYISRLFIKNFRNFKYLDLSLKPNVTCIIGENNSGKTNMLHAIRLAIDSNLSSTYRMLSEDDIYSGIDISNPKQVIISIEFSDFKDDINADALVGCWSIGEDLARICYRFRPKQQVREDISSGERQAGTLTIEDYHWEITGGGDKEPSDIDWQENIGTSVRFSDLQSFLVVYLKALRDVENDLRSSRFSPLAKLFDTYDITEDEKESLIQILEEANKEIAESDIISQAGTSISSAFDNTVGDTFGMEVNLGMVEPSFSSIARSLTLLLSDNSLSNFEPFRNGLGLNNILYISMLLEYFERRMKNAKTAGQLFLFEEPEAHLHPQLQRTLLQTLLDKGFQTILTTHSTHISSKSPIDSYVVLTDIGKRGIFSTNIVPSVGLLDKEQSDLERYLDATKSTLLYAKKVILVEGPAELFIIPLLVKQVLGKDLDRCGISVIPIYGIHFQVYAKLFGSNGLPKKCAIIADGDLKPSDADKITDDEDFDESTIVPVNLKELENDYVKIFDCKTTFEQALTIPGTLPMLLKGVQELGATRISRQIKDAIDTLQKGVEGEVRKKLFLKLREKILNTSKHYGKARFAQTISKYTNLATGIPSYIQDAIDWLIAK